MASLRGDVGVGGIIVHKLDVLSGRFVMLEYGSDLLQTNRCCKVWRFLLEAWSALSKVAIFLFNSERTLFIWLVNCWTAIAA